MGVNTLPDRSGVISRTHPNEIHQALKGEFVGRNIGTGAPEAGQPLGSPLYPWGVARVGSLIVNGQLVNFSALGGDTHKIISGKKRSTSNQPAFLTPAGASGGPAFDVKGATAPLSFEVSGTQGTIATDVTTSGLATAPGSNNTCLLNDTTAASQEATRTWGEPESGVDLTVDAMGSAISALVGSYAAFKVVNGASTEYFLAFVESTTKLRCAFRGYFYNPSLAPMNRIKLADNNVITLMKVHWIFADTAGTIATTGNVPSVDVNTPSGPATGDYWFDLANSQWKRYDGAAFQVVSRVLVGCVIVDATDCVGARCMDFFAAYAPDSSIEVERTSSSVVQGSRIGQRASVAGNYLRFQTARPYWDMATDLAGSADMYDASEQPSRPYFFYLKDTGGEVTTDISPYFRGELSGWYHPHNPWRCFGKALNDASSNLDPATIVSLNTLEHNSIGTSHIVDGAVTRAKMAPVGESASALITSAYGNNTTTFTTVVSRTWKKTGRPVWIGLATDEGDDAATVSIESTSTNPQGNYRFTRDGTSLGGAALGGLFAASGVGTVLQLPFSQFSAIDRSGTTGDVTYAFQMKTPTSTISAKANHIKLLVFEFA